MSSVSDRSRLRRTTTHACPGDCGHQVPQHRLACQWCWYLLPADQRNEITRLYRVDRMAHLGAVGEALAWYRANVVDGALVVPR